MIARMWKARASRQKADGYEAWLRTAILPALKASEHGPLDMEIYRRTDGEAVEFVTIMWFNNLDDVRKFAGENYEKAIVADEDRQALIDFDEAVSHFEVVGKLSS